MMITELAKAMNASLTRARRSVQINSFFESSSVPGVSAFYDPSVTGL